MPKDSFRSSTRNLPDIPTVLAFWRSSVKYKSLQVETRERKTTRSPFLFLSSHLSVRELTATWQQNIHRPLACLQSFRAIRTQAGGATQSSMRRVECVSYTWYAANTSPSPSRAFTLASTPTAASRFCFRCARIVPRLAVFAYIGQSAPLCRAKRLMKIILGN